MVDGLVGGSLARRRRAREAVLGGFHGTRRGAVCVRKMFEEERGGNPGALAVTVLPPEGDGVPGRAAAALRGVFEKRS